MDIRPHQYDPDVRLQDEQKHMRKGQGAMEFLLTYGWAILVVIVVISALAYYGILTPGKLLPDKCMFKTGAVCQDYVAYYGGLLFFGDWITTTSTPPMSSLSFDLVNGLGKSVYVTGIKVTGDNLKCAPLQIDRCGTGTYGSTLKIIIGTGADGKSEVQGKVVEGNDCVSVVDLMNSFCEAFETTYAEWGLECRYDETTKKITTSVPGVDMLIPSADKMIFWPAGKPLKMQLDLIKADYFSIPCTVMPSPGSKAKATVTIEYYEKDPNFRHTLTGDIYLTVQKAPETGPAG